MIYTHHFRFSSVIILSVKKSVQNIINIIGTANTNDNTKLRSIGDRILNKNLSHTNVILIFDFSYYLGRLNI